ncbi:MAG TPA: hypothetical protein VFC90_02235 [Planctomycetota bacterium]|nr:hypothetical protein [Planctomycetota bacterium]
MSERQMTIVLLVVMGLTILVGAGVLYWMRFVVLDEKEVQLADLNKKVDDAKAKQRAIKGLEEKIKTLTEGIDRIRQQIPVFNPKEENDKFADLVDMLRKKCRVHISGARFASAKVGGPGDNIPDSIFRARYEMKVSGGFYQLLNFLNHLETERRFMVADSIRIVAGGASDEKRMAPVRELQLNLSTYLQRPPTPPPGVPVAAAKPGDKPGEKPGEKPVEKPVEPTEDMKKPSTPIPD